MIAIMRVDFTVIIAQLQRDNVSWRLTHETFAPDKTLSVSSNGSKEGDPGDPGACEENEGE